MNTASRTPLIDRLRLNAGDAVREITTLLHTQVSQSLRRYGLVVAISGGIDSAVCVGLAVEALGPRRVLGLALPERESDPESLVLAKDWAERLHIDFVEENITGTLEAAGCYARRDAAIARVTEYGDGWRSKLVVEDAAVPNQLPTSYLVVQSPDGVTSRVRLPAREFREIVAATNFKQRVRTMHAYSHADSLRYAVCGTPNRLEYELGFFVKGGDGLADVKPIAHLFKSQVYQLAEHLGVPSEIRHRTPTTDTYSLLQTQEEFFFSLPLAQLDLILFARAEGLCAAEIAAELQLDPQRVTRALSLIESRRRAAEYLHAVPLLVDGTESMAQVVPGAA
jgi:NAD+ synthase